MEQAFDIFNKQYIPIDDAYVQETPDAYEPYRKNTGPYANKRVYWIHKQDKYIVFVIRKAQRTLPFVIQQTNFQELDTDEVGRTIEDFKLADVEHLEAYLDKGKSLVKKTTTSSSSSLTPDDGPPVFKRMKKNPQLKSSADKDNAFVTTHDSLKEEYADQAVPLHKQSEQQTTTDDTGVVKKEEQLQLDELQLDANPLETDMQQRELDESKTDIPVVDTSTKMQPDESKPLQTDMQLDESKTDIPVVDSSTKMQPDESKPLQTDMQLDESKTDIPVVDFSTKMQPDESKPLQTDMQLDESKTETDMPLVSSTKMQLQTTDHGSHLHEEKPLQTAEIDQTIDEQRAADAEPADDVQQSSLLPEELQLRSELVPEELQQLRSELDQCTDKLSQAESDRADWERKHKNYIKQKQNEHKKLNAELQQQKSQLASAPSIDEFERLKDSEREARNELSKAQSVMHTGGSSKTSDDPLPHPKECMMDLINLAQTSLENSIKEDGEFEFLDNAGQWATITDSCASSALLRLIDGHEQEVKYSIGGHNYVSKLITHTDYEIVQKNLDPQYLTERYIRVSSKHLSSKALGKKVSDHKANKVLFGDSSIKLLPSFLKKMLSGYNFHHLEMYEPCAELASLGTLFSSLASGFTYCSLKSELWLKPIALCTWLNIANARGYTHCRIVMHGGDTITYNGVKHDPLGFDMRHAGKNGKAHGDGLYFGLSDHVTVGYNRSSGYPAGTAILGLILTYESISNHHGGYHTAAVDPSKNTIEQRLKDAVENDDFTTAAELGSKLKNQQKLPEDSDYTSVLHSFTLSAPRAQQNCIVLKDPPLVLPLGLVIAKPSQSQSSS